MRTLTLALSTLAFAALANAQQTQQSTAPPAQAIAAPAIQETPQEAAMSCEDLHAVSDRHAQAVRHIGDEIQAESQSQFASNDCADMQACQDSLEELDASLRRIEDLNDQSRAEGAAGLRAIHVADQHRCDTSHW